MTRTKKAAAGVAAALLAAVVACRLLIPDAGPETAVVAAPPGAPGARSQPVAPRSSSPAGASEAAPARRIDAARRQELLSALASARVARTYRAAPALRPQRGGDDWLPQPALTGGELDKESIRLVIRDALPLVRECYVSSLDERPGFAGKLEIEFTIAGEPEVGGLVEEVELDSGDGMTELESFTECVRETVLSLEFPPPAAGGQVTVRYPFQFTHD